MDGEATRILVDNVAKAQDRAVRGEPIYGILTMSRDAAIEAIEESIAVQRALGLPVPPETLDTLAHLTATPPATPAAP